MSKRPDEVYQILGRFEAECLGLAWYFIPMRCEQGHLAPRRVEDGYCVHCFEEWNRKSSLVYLRKNSGIPLDAPVRPIRKNKEEQKEHARIRNNEYQRKYLKEYRKSNLEETRTYFREYQRTRKSKMSAEEKEQQRIHNREYQREYRAKQRELKKQGLLE